MPTLDSKIRQWADKTINLPSDYADLDNYYPNQGVTWFHELLHVGWASLNSAPHISDIKIGFRIKGVMKWFKAYVQS